MKKENKSIIFAILAAAFLYLGAGIGMGVMMLVRRRVSKTVKEERLTHSDVSYAAAMVTLDIVAPIVMAVGCWLAGR